RSGRCPNRRNWTWCPHPRARRQAPAAVRVPAIDLFGSRLRRVSTLGSALQPQPASEGTMPMRRIMIMIVLAGAVGRFGYQMARSPVLPLFGHSLGGTGASLGLIVAASTMTGVILKLPAGALSDLWGRRVLLRIGAIFFALPPFLYVFVHSPEALLALRFVHGMATAIYGPVASAVVASLSSRGRAARLGFLASAQDIGSASGPLVGGFVLAWTASYY